MIVLKVCLRSSCRVAFLLSKRTKYVLLLAAYVALVRQCARTCPFSSTYLIILLLGSPTDMLHQAPDRA